LVVDTLFWTPALPCEKRATKRKHSTEVTPAFSEAGFLTHARRLILNRYRSLIPDILLFACFSPKAPVSTESLSPITPIPLCDLRNLRAMLSNPRVSRPSATDVHQTLSSTTPVPPSVTSVTSVRCFPQSACFSPISHRCPPNPLVHNAGSPLCDLRDLCAMLSPIRVSRPESALSIEVLSPNHDEVFSNQLFGHSDRLRAGHLCLP
jgi:hypothetical protein